jgi:hypothetical protein
MSDHDQHNPPLNESDTALRGSAFLQSDDVLWQPSGARQNAKGNPQGERGGVHQFGVPPMTALRGSAFQISEGTPQVASAARDNNANFAWVQHFIHHLAPGRAKTN